MSQYRDRAARKAESLRAARLKGLRRRMTNWLMAVFIIGAMVAAVVLLLLSRMKEQ